MSMRSKSYWKHFPTKSIHLLIKIIHLIVITKNADCRDYDEFNEQFDNAVRHNEQFVFDPLGENFESDDLEYKTEFSKSPEELITDPIDIFPSIDKPMEVRREVVKTPKMINTVYQTNFDQRYERMLNYSEIFNVVDDPSNSSSFFPVTRILSSSNYSFASFPSLDEIYEYLKVLETSSKGRAVVFPLRHHEEGWKIVRTNFGNVIPSIRVKSKSERYHDDNPIIVVVAGIHGRDWYAIQSAIFVARELVINGSGDVGDDLDWWIIPVLNPDGYELSRSDSKWRNWEKNLEGTREMGKENKCFGVDLDFCFEYQWLSCNESLCDDNFSGEAPFSVPEARGLRDTLEAFSDNLNSFVALKEGRQSLVYPFSDTLESPRHLQSIEKICKEALKSFSKHVDAIYDYGQSSHLIKMRAGYIEDWAKIHLGVEKSFALYLGPAKKDRRELRSQHLEDHMNGAFDVLKVIANGIIYENLQNSSDKLDFSFIYILINILVVRRT